MGWLATEPDFWGVQIDHQKIPKCSVCHLTFVLWCQRMRRNLFKGTTHSLPSQILRRRFRPSIKLSSHFNVFCPNPGSILPASPPLHRRTKHPHKLKPNTSAWRLRLIQPITRGASELIGWALNNVACCKLVKWHCQELRAVRLLAVNEL